MITTFLLTISLLAVPSLSAEDWPNWRGPQGTGVSSESALPTQWSAQENITWKAPLRGLGISSPVVWGDRIFVTSQIGRGRVRRGDHPELARGPGSQPELERPLGGRLDRSGDSNIVFLVQAFQRSDGRKLWEFEMAAEGNIAGVHDKHNLSSPSCTTDGTLLYAWFGTGQLVALDMEGTLVWKRHLGTEYSPFEVTWGHGSSPTIYQDLLILLCDHAPASYLLALDKATGQERWKVDRGQELRSYSTPLVIQAPNRKELIINSSIGIDAYAPATGKHLWYIREPSRYPVPSPSADAGILYMSRGQRSGPYMAIRTGGEGDVSGSHVRWRVATGAPYISSLLYYQGLIYMANGRGVMTAVDGQSGEIVWRERVGGVFSASPVAGDGKIYFQSEDGTTLVIKAGRSYELVSRNRLAEPQDTPERTLATPAISRGQIFIRSDRHLFCIGTESS